MSTAPRISGATLAQSPVAEEKQKARAEIAQTEWKAAATSSSA